MEIFIKKIKIRNIPMIFKKVLDKTLEGEEYIKRFKLKDSD